MSMKYTLKDLQVLTDSSLKFKKLTEMYPDELAAVNKELNKLYSESRKEELYQYIQNLKNKSEFAIDKINKSGNNPKTINAFLPHILKGRIATLALTQYNLAIQSGQVSGKVRFSLLNGFILQKLLFEHDFVRKPASLKLFRLIWPFITQKKILIPLVNKKGIYCFYTKELISRLSSIIGNKKCIEIGAGDGTLYRFLKQTGSDITASDNFSWTGYIDYPESVERLSAKQAIEKHKPEVVICSWPPPWNDFEKHVFSAHSVNLYIVIGSTNENASGNRQAYSSQKTFSMTEDKSLASLILPPGTHNSVFIFKRI